MKIDFKLKNGNKNDFFRKSFSFLMLRKGKHLLVQDERRCFFKGGKKIAHSNEPKSNSLVNHTSGTSCRENWIRLAENNDGFAYSHSNLLAKHKTRVKQREKKKIFFWARLQPVSIFFWDEARQLLHRLISLLRDCVSENFSDKNLSRNFFSLITLKKANSPLQQAKEKFQSNIGIFHFGITMNLAEKKQNHLRQKLKN